MPVPDIIFYEVFKEEEEALRRHLPADLNIQYTWQTIQERAALSDTPPSIISVRTQSRIPLEWAPDLKGILTRSTGYDHIGTYLDESRANIPCGYLPTYCSRAVAEHAVMVAMMLLRKYPAQQKQCETFQRDNITGRECIGRNILIVGVGNIGSQIADIAQGLSMNVTGVDINPKRTDIDYVVLQEGIPWADIIVCAVPLTDSTVGMLGYDALKAARKGVVVVNIARGEVTPAVDILRLVQAGLIGGVGFDVFEDEQLFAEQLRDENIEKSPATEALAALHACDNTIFTPHNAFNTEESVERKAQQSAEALALFLRERRFPHRVPTP